MHVLILEAGPRFNPGADYRLHRPDWERFLFPDPAGSRGDFTIGTLGRLDPADEELRSWNRASGPLVRGNMRQAANPGYWHVQGVGGSTLHFVGESHRMHPDAMKLASQHGAGCDWPLDYAGLEPYYTLCENLVGVAGPAEQGARWRSQPYPLPPHPPSPSARKLLAAGRRLNMKWQENSRAALSMPFDGRPACNYCGNCSRGCPLGDKGSADVTFIRKAEASGRLTVKPLCPVVRFHSGAGGTIGSVEYIDNKKLQRVETPILILAAGAVQTPRLLLANRNRLYPEGFANSSGQVGRNFMETLSWSSSGLVAGLSHSHAGLPADVICWDFNAPDAIPGVIGGCRFNSATQEIGFTGPIAYASRVVSGFGAQLKNGVRTTFGRVMSVGAIGEFLPNEGTYVDLDPSRKDRLGMPFPRLHSQLERGEIQRLKFMASQSRRLLKEAGAELVEEAGAWDNFSATHVFGTCRMGNNPKTSVVDSHCRCHDHSNLFITDASVFPSSGGGEAPSLTISALAVRTADAIVSG
ncbi:GMC family oxidoreductase [Sulfurimicrobium lacus]|uniref:GMC family oxidoreductase n=1 Tax=Sulfurimicrobium lacus TaxID=2715678 RepID=A0A6F8VH15_9PROT|nr:GMC family oxidoreductase [Sulfurimicrobium lacus]